MIKRRFYKLEHHGGDSASSSSSSSSSSSEDFDHEDEGNPVSEEEEKKQEEPPSLSAGSSGSGYESEDSSVNEVNCDSTGLLVNDYGEDSGEERKNLKDSQIHEGHPEGTKKLASKNVFKTIDANDPIQAEIVDFVVKCKSVFKCKICPRILCLSEDTLLQHLRSKRHGRSKRLLGEGRLKLMLNSDGEAEEEQETHAERHARIVALGQVNKEQETHTEGHASTDTLLQKDPKSKNKGRQRQRQRRKMKLCKGGDGDNTNPPQKKQTAKRLKIED